MQHIQAQQAAQLAETMREGCLGLRVTRLHRLVARRFDQSLRPLGLSLPQMEVLAALTLGGQPVKPGVLADLLDVERSTLSRNLTLMERRGWVSTARTSPTGRSMAVTITEAGTSTLAQATQAWNDAQDAVGQILGAQASSAMDTWLAGLASLARRDTVPSPR